MEHPADDIHGFQQLVVCAQIAEVLGQDEIVPEFLQGSLSDVIKIGFIPGPTLVESFRDISRDGHAGPAHLRNQPEFLLARKSPRNFIDHQDKLMGFFAIPPGLGTSRLFSASFSSPQPCTLRSHASGCSYLPSPSPVSRLLSTVYRLPLTVYHLPTSVSPPSCATRGAGPDGPCRSRALRRNGRAFSRSRGIPRGSLGASSL